METQKLKVEMIPLSLLSPSTTNPRKTFDDVQLGELAKSIEAQGVLVPLLVRPLKKGFEIVAGERRFRAAKLAKVAELPARKMELTDEQVLEIQLIENLQRVDVHPLEEAEAYRLLLKHPDSTIQKLSGQIGKPPAYIAQRLKLLALLPELKKAFVSGKITEGHARLLCRLQPDAQKEIIKERLFDGFNDGDPISVAHLQEVIEETVMLDLSEAPFDVNDAKLLPEAGSCTACPKRTGFDKHLFADIKKKDACTDKTCFHKKQDALVKLTIAAGVIPVTESYVDRGTKLPENTLAVGTYTEIENPKKACQHAKDGVVVHGSDKGKKIKVCAEKSCKEHGGRMNNVRSTGSEETPQVRAARLKKEREAKLKIAVRRKVLVAISEQSDKLDPEDMKLVALCMWNRLYHDLARKVLLVLGWMPDKTVKDRNSGSKWEEIVREKVEEMKPYPLNRFLMFITLSFHMDGPPMDGYGSHAKKLPDPLMLAAKKFKVNVDKVEKEVRAAAEKPKAKAAAK